MNSIREHSIEEPSSSSPSETDSDEAESHSLLEKNNKPVYKDENHGEAPHPGCSSIQNGGRLRLHPRKSLEEAVIRKRGMKRGDSFLYEVADSLPMAPAPDFVVSLLCRFCPNN